MVIFQPYKNLKNYNFVIPAQAGIQLINNITRSVTTYKNPNLPLSVMRRYSDRLDSRLRGNDK